MLQRKISPFFLFLSLVSSSSVFASGFQVSELTAAQMGSANAGAAAIGSDVTSSFYNAATLATLAKPTASTGVAAVFNQTEFTGTVNTRNTNGSSSSNKGTNNVNGARGDTNSILPNFFLAYPINHQLVFGLSATSPYNWSNSYSRFSAMEWFNKENKLNAQMLSPSLGMHVTPSLMFGVGFDASKVYANFDHYSNGNYNQAGDSFDNESRSHVDGSGYGWHFGVLFEPGQRTHIGLAYRSQIVNHLNGSSKFSGINASFIQGLLNSTEITSNDTKMDLTLPSSTTLSLTHEVSDHWTLLGSVSYTEWSKTSGLTLQGALSTETVFANFVTTHPPKLTNTILLPAIRDTWQISLGSKLKVNDKWTVRGGVGFDQSPIANNRTRSPLLPDNNAYNLGLGASYQFTHAVSMDLGWMHAFINNAGTDGFTRSDAFQTSSTADGTSKNSMDIVGLQMTWSFV